MHIVRQQGRAFAATELVIDMPDGSRVTKPPDEAAVRFSVAYTLEDYSSMVREHVRFLLRHAAPEVKRRRILLPLVLGAAAWALAGAALLTGSPGWTSGLLLALGSLAVGTLPGTSGFWVALLGTPLFLLKQRRMPVCDFTIDDATIAYSAKAGNFRRGWDEVTGVRSYSRGYLLVFRRAALPIPFRCLDSSQLERLRARAFARPD